MRKRAAPAERGGSILRPSSRVESLATRMVDTRNAGVNGVSSVTANTPGKAKTKARSGRSTIDVVHKPSASSFFKAVPEGRHLAKLRQLARNQARSRCSECDRSPDNSRDPALRLQRAILRDLLETLTHKKELRSQVQRLFRRRKDLSRNRWRRRYTLIRPDERKNSLELPDDSNYQQVVSLVREIKGTFDFPSPTARRSSKMRPNEEATSQMNYGSFVRQTVDLTQLAGPTINLTRVETSPAPPAKNASPNKQSGTSAACEKRTSHSEGIARKLRYHNRCFPPAPTLRKSGKTSRLELREEIKAESPSRIMDFQNMRKELHIQAGEMVSLCPRIVMWATDLGLQVGVHDVWFVAPAVGL